MAVTVCWECGVLLNTVVPLHFYQAWQLHRCGYEERPKTGQLWNTENGANFVAESKIFFFSHHVVSFFSLSQTPEWWELGFCFIIFSHRSREAQCVLYHVIIWAITGLLHDCRPLPLASLFSVTVVKAWWWWRKQPDIRKGCKGCKLQSGRGICKHLLFPFADVSTILLPLGADMRRQ